MGLAEADKELKPEFEPAEVEVLLEKEPLPDIAEPIAASPREGKITRGSWLVMGLAEADKELKPEFEPAEVEVLLEKEPVPDIAEPIAASPREGRYCHWSS